jgi:hypothetical protein
MFQRDYILRMMEAVAQVAARVLRLLRQQKKPEEAQQVVAEGYNALSLDREMLLMLDGPSVRTHCGDDDEKLGLAVRLLLLDCEVQVHKVDKREAQRTLRAARRALQEIAKRTQAPEDLAAELEGMTQAVADMDTP